MNFTNFTTEELEQRFAKEQERVFKILLNVFPISQETLEHLLVDLKLMHEELKKRRINPESNFVRKRI